MKNRLKSLGNLGKITLLTGIMVGIGYLGYNLGYNSGIKLDNARESSYTNSTEERLKVAVKNPGIKATTLFDWRLAVNATNLMEDLDRLKEMTFTRYGYNSFHEFLMEANESEKKEFEETRKRLYGEYDSRLEKVMTSEKPMKDFRLIYAQTPNILKDLKQEDK